MSFHDGISKLNNISARRTLISRNQRASSGNVMLCYAIVFQPLPAFYLLTAQTV